MRNYYGNDEKPREVISKISEHNSINQTLPELNFEEIKYAARIAVYDNMLSTPRVVTVEPSTVDRYLDAITTQTYSLAKEQGGTLPYTVIRELVENFIHAYFIEPTVSIMENGNKIRFTDQGPGITNIALAQKVGITSATTNMKKYIRGVGSGLPVVREYLDYSGGSLSIEKNIKSGTVVTISATQTLTTPQSLSNQQHAMSLQIKIDDRERAILELTNRLNAVGPTELNEFLDIKISTGHRLLKNLEEKELLIAGDTGDKKRMLTKLGKQILQSL